MMPSWQKTQGIISIRFLPTTVFLRTVLEDSSEVGFKIADFYLFQADFCTSLVGDGEP